MVRRRVREGGGGERRGWRYACLERYCVLALEAANAAQLSGEAAVI